MNKRNIYLVLFVAVLLLSPAAEADKKAYVFDKNHSEINFVAEATLLSAHGFFGTFDGEVQIDADKMENSTLTITIDTASINTRNDRRDNHLRSADFFDATSFPKITFTSNKITPVDPQNLSIEGTMTIRGVSKPMVIPMRVVFLRDGRGRFKGEFKLNRKDFGINYNSRVNSIEDMVSVQFDFNLADQQMMQQRQQQQPKKGN